MPFSLFASESFKVTLTGARQVPPVETAATGTAELTYDPATRVLTWTLSYSGLSGPATMAHFHGPAAQGKNGSPVIWLSPKGSPVQAPVNPRAGAASPASGFLPTAWIIWGPRSAASGACVVSSVEELRANADECLDWARTARTEREGEIFLQMARAWLEAAARREGASQLAQAPGGCDDQNLTQSGKSSVGAYP
jgi:hypothetical protein